MRTRPPTTGCPTTCQVWRIMGQIALSPKKESPDEYTADDTTGSTAAPDTANLARDLALQRLQAATAKHELLLRQIEESNLSMLALAAQTPAGTSTHDIFPTAPQTAYPHPPPQPLQPRRLQWSKHSCLPPRQLPPCTTPSSLSKPPTWSSLARRSRVSATKRADRP